MSDKLIGWIETKRADKGWAIREVARRSGLSPTTISDVLNHKANPGLDFYKGIAQGFGEPLLFILRLAGELPFTSSDGKADLCRDYFESLPSYLQDHLLQIAHTFYGARSDYQVQPPAESIDKREKGSNN